MSSVLTEILAILALFVLNGVFAMAELAVVSARRTRLQQIAEEGDRRANVALELLDNSTHFLSTVQIGITLIGVLTGALGGATLAHRLAPWLAQVPLLAPYSAPLSLAIIVVLVTYLSLIIGELVPKRLALNNPERVAILVAPTMRLLSRLAAPLVRILSVSTELVARLLGASSSQGPPVTEEELKVMLREGAAAGIFEEKEQDMVERALNLDDIRVGRVMTPYPDIVWLDIHADAQEIRRTLGIHSYSMYPVADGHLDRVVGVVRAKDLLNHCLNSETLDLHHSLCQPLFVSSATTPVVAIELFRQTGTHLALTIDERGNIEGLITPTDILESIVGDISASQRDPAQQQAVQRPDGSWLLDGMLPVDDLRQLLELEELPEESGVDYLTLGGFVMDQLERVPQIGDQFEWNGIQFEVLDMDGRRVDRVLVIPALSATTVVGETHETMEKNNRQ